MGFHHTSYMEFHEPTGWLWLEDAPPSPPEYTCGVCGEVFHTPDDLAVHEFDGHTTSRPVLLLRGRECGRLRVAVISHTMPRDWTFRNARAIRVNGRAETPAAARTKLSTASMGVVSVVLAGEVADQEFEFSFEIANEDDLTGVDEKLADLVRGRSLTVNSIEAFIDWTNRYVTARRYRDGLVNYFYGVLAREGSPESGLVGRDGHHDEPPYTARFNDAVIRLGDFEHPAAEAICGLVAFHYNQFDTALRKTRSPRVARASRRLACLLGGSPAGRGDLDVGDRRTLDRVLSDAEIEKVLSWCCIPLDGTATAAVQEIEAALADEQPSDQLKLRVVAAEHYLAAGDAEEGLRHVSALRHSPVAESWASAYRDRLVGGAS